MLLCSCAVLAACADLMAVRLTACARAHVPIPCRVCAAVVAGGAPAYVLRLPGPLNQAITSWWNTITASIAGFASQASPELLGIMSMPKPESKLTLDFASILGPLFFTWVVQLLLPTL